MASKRDRQRKLERARAERRMARQAHKVRQRRQVQAIVGVSVVVILIVLGVIFIVKPFGGSSPQAGGCVWEPLDPATNPNAVDAGGTPPTEGIPTSGTAPMTLTTNQGTIVVTLDLAKAPCAAASFGYLGSKNFFASSSCSSVSSQLEVIQCGDPKSDGSGGPSYQFADEYIPQEPVGPSPSASASPSPTADAGPPTYYTTGQVIMVNTGANTNGSQFMIVTGDHSSISNAHTVIGTVTQGMDIVEKIAKDGAVDDKGAAVPEGKLKTPLTIQALTVGPAVAATTPSPSGSASPSPSASSPAPQS